MDLSQIRAFLAVCETKSFTKAARQINMSQPSISLKIKALEKHLGAKLLIREQNNLQLTDEGCYAEEKFLDIISKTIAIEEYFSQVKILTDSTITVYHAEKDSCSGLEHLLIKLKNINNGELKIQTVSCDSDQRVINEIAKHINAIGITTTQQINSGLSSHTWLQEEFMLVKAKSNEELNETSVDLCSLLNEQIWLPELNSASLDLLRNRIQTLGLDIDDFKNRAHVPEKLMAELVQADGKMGICLCDQLPTKTHSKVRINELATPYRTYLHINPKSNKTILNLIDNITNHDKMQSVKKTTIPILDRQIGLVAINNKSTEVIPVRVAMQSRTIQTVISGRAVQKLGLYESFLSEVNRIQKQIFTAEWKDYKSAAPILLDLEAGKLDIAIVGDYAVAHAANNIDTKDDVIVIGFASINPYGSGSRLMIHKDSTNLGLTGLKDKTIHVPFLSTAHGSLLYNLKLKNILNQNNIVDLSLERKKAYSTKIINPDGLACFTPFDHFFESEQGYQKSEDEVSMPFSFYAIIARKNFASSYPDAVTSFLKATLCSNYWFQSTPSSISYLSRWTGVNEAYVNQVLGERTENDCHYIPEINVRTDWVKEFSKNLFVTGEGKTTTAESGHPLINDDFLKSAKHQLGITT